MDFTRDIGDKRRSPYVAIIVHWYCSRTERVRSAVRFVSVLDNFLHFFVIFCLSLRTLWKLVRAFFLFLNLKEHYFNYSEQNARTVYRAVRMNPIALKYWSLFFSKIKRFSDTSKRETCSLEFLKFFNIHCASLCTTVSVLNTKKSNCGR